MSSPAKRRKKNDFQTSSQPVRSLEFFFAKQKKDLLCNPEISDGTHRDGVQEPESNARSHIPPNGGLTDEELARQLQDEWNNENPGSGNVGHIEEAVEVVGDQGIRSPAPTVNSPGSPKPTTDVVESPYKNVAVKPQPATLSLQSVADATENASTRVPFDESPLTFDPSVHLPGLRKVWAVEGGDTSYGLLVRCFVLVNSTQSRIKIVDTLVNLLRTIIEGDPDSLLPAVIHTPQIDTRSLILIMLRCGLQLMRFLRLTYR
jgi:DNA ligase-1